MSTHPDLSDPSTLLTGPPPAMQRGADGRWPSWARRTRYSLLWYECRLCEKGGREYEDDKPYLHDPDCPVETGLWDLAVACLAAVDSSDHGNCG